MKKSNLKISVLLTVAMVFVYAIAQPEGEKGFRFESPMVPQNIKPVQDEDRASIQNSTDNLKNIFGGVVEDSNIIHDARNGISQVIKDYEANPSKDSLDKVLVTVSKGAATIGNKCENLKSVREKVFQQTSALKTILGKFKAKVGEKIAHQTTNLKEIDNTYTLILGKRDDIYNALLAKGKDVENFSNEDLKKLPLSVQADLVKLLSASKELEIRKRAKEAMVRALEVSSKKIDQVTEGVDRLNITGDLISSLGQSIGNVVNTVSEMCAVHVEAEATIACFADLDNIEKEVNNSIQVLNQMGIMDFPFIDYSQIGEPKEEPSEKPVLISTQDLVEFIKAGKPKTETGSIE